MRHSPPAAHPPSAAWVRDGDGEAYLSLHVVPRAAKTGVVGLHGESLKVRVAAPPADDKANDALIRFLSAELGLPRAAIRLLAGRASRDKRLALAGISARDVEDRLAAGVGRA